MKTFGLAYLWLLLGEFCAQKVCFFLSSCSEWGFGNVLSPFLVCDLKRSFKWFLRKNKECFGKWFFLCCVCGAFVMIFEIVFENGFQKNLEKRCISFAKVLECVFCQFSVCGDQKAV